MVWICEYKKIENNKNKCKQWVCNAHDDQKKKLVEDIKELVEEIKIMKSKVIRELEKSKLLKSDLQVKTDKRQK